MGVSGIRTRIVGVEGEHTDHLTTTTAQFVNSNYRYAVDCGKQLNSDGAKMFSNCPFDSLLSVKKP